MKQELDRVKNDVETMQKAMGLAPSVRREWIPWMKRDNWLNLWWCLPGIMLIASSYLPSGNAEKYFGLVLAQWSGILVAAAMLGLMIISIRKMTANDGRPQSLIREYKRYWGIDAHGRWVCLALSLEFLLYFLWARHFEIGLGAFWSGLCILVGSTYIVLAIISKLWLLLGVAVPFLVYGLFEALLPGKGKIGGIPLGIMFIGIGLSSAIIQVWQIRQIERQNESH
jgi:drug/metabolite transporter superfamily protein YnfA